jgi:hypothetical protein
MRAIYDPNLGLGWDKKGQPVADSRRVAAQFDKRHADVLRDKEALNAKLRSASRDPADYFQPQFYRDPTGRQLPYFRDVSQGVRSSGAELCRRCSVPGESGLHRCVA